MPNLTPNMAFGTFYHHTLGIQIAQSRQYLHTLGPKVGIIYILGPEGISGHSDPLGSRDFGLEGVSMIHRGRGACRLPKGSM